MRFREEKTEEKGGLRMEAKCVKMIISIEKKLNAIEMNINDDEEWNNGSR